LPFSISFDSKKIYTHVERHFAARPEHTSRGRLYSISSRFPCESEDRSRMRQS
jgi:hypothetical protein